MTQIVALLIFVGVMDLFGIVALCVWMGRGR